MVPLLFASPAPACLATVARGLDLEDLPLLIAAYRFRRAGVGTCRLHGNPRRCRGLASKLGARLHVRRGRDGARAVFT